MLKDNDSKPYSGALVLMCLFVFLLSGCMGLNRNTAVDKDITKQELISQKTINSKTNTAEASTGNKEKNNYQKEIETIPDNSSVEQPQRKNKFNIPKKTIENKIIYDPGLDVPKINDFQKMQLYDKDAESDLGNASQDSSPGVAFNFDDADLYEVIQAMAELLNINYIVDPNIRGKVTIHTTGKLKKTDLYPLFYQVLEANNLTALQEGKLLKIISNKEISKTPGRIIYGRKYQDVPKNERLITQIVPLKNISVNSMKPILVPFLSDVGIILEQNKSNILVIIEKDENLKRLLKLVDTFDVDIFAQTKHQFFKFKHMVASEGIALIQEFIAPYLKIEESECQLIQIEKLNAIVAITSDDRILAKIGDFINEIDKTDISNDTRIFIYRAKNSMAEELVALLNNLFQKKEDNLPNTSIKNTNTGAEQKKNDFLPFGAGGAKKKSVSEASQRTSPTSKVLNKPGMGGSNSLSGEIRIIADAIRNTIIIEALPSDFILVERVLKELDILPRQVLIDVLVADITLTDNFEFGVGWTFKNGVTAPSGLNELSAGGDGGISLTTVFANKWKVALNTLAADSKLDVLSSPSILASDNKSASINIGKKIPIVSSTYSADDRVIGTTVQYQDTGITLDVTPHIFDNGMVTMEISQKVNDASGTGPNPIIVNKSINTTVTVQNNQSIVIGGLISDTNDKKNNGIPWIYKIPILGGLFGHQVDNKTKSELVVMITPHVIETLDDLDFISNEFRKKLSSFNRQNGGL